MATFAIVPSWKTNSIHPVYTLQAPVEPIIIVTFEISNLTQVMFIWDRRYDVQDLGYGLFCDARLEKTVAIRHITIVPRPNESHYRRMERPPHDRLTRDPEVGVSVNVKSSLTANDSVDAILPRRPGQEVIINDVETPQGAMVTLLETGQGIASGWRQPPDSGAGRGGRAAPPSLLSIGIHAEKEGHPAISPIGR